MASPQVNISPTVSAGLEPGSLEHQQAVLLQRHRDLMGSLPGTRRVFKPSPLL